MTRELCQASVLQHRDRGVKVIAACCLANLLRLYAPEAPLNEHELQAVFTLFIDQLQHMLADVDGPYYQYCCTLIESLSTVKSTILIADLSQSDSLTR